VDFCQDDPVVRLRMLAVTAASTLVLAGCGDSGDARGRAEATPTFVSPSGAVPSGAVPSSTSGQSDAAPAAPGTPATAPSAPAGSGGVPSTTAPTRRPVRYVFPVAAGNVDFHPTHAKYPATDIFAACGEPVVAVLDGVILEVSRTDDYVKGRADGPLNGGLSVSLLGDDGVRYYGSHLSQVRAGIDAGVRVKAGQRLGSVGRTGNANNVCHLHFGLSPRCAGTGDWKIRRGVVWPADFLTSWRRDGGRSPAAAVAAWQRANNCRS
jgi:murein DD-endopeptidase MepM/ murein hydrolase activator NlpD